MKDSFNKRLFTAILILLTILLIFNSLNLAHTNKEKTPLSEFYRDNIEETGSESIVESILLDYRAYDTFGEVMVLYIAIAGVLILGKNVKGGEKD